MPNPLFTKVIQAGVVYVSQKLARRVLPKAVPGGLVMLIGAEISRQLWMHFRHKENKRPSSRASSKTSAPKRDVKKKRN